MIVQNVASSEACKEGARRLLDFFVPAFELAKDFFAFVLGSDMVELPPLRHDPHRTGCDETQATFEVGAASLTRRINLAVDAAKFGGKITS